MKRIIITIILLLGFLGVFFGLTWQEYRELEKNLEIAEIKQNNIDNMVEYSLGMEEIVRTLERDYKEEDEKLSASLPDDHYAPSLLASVQELAMASGVAIDHFGGFGVHEHREVPHLNRVELDLRMQGGYENFKHFALGLENLSRIVSLREIRIEKPSVEEERMLDYIIIIDAFSY